MKFHGLLMQVQQIIIFTVNKYEFKIILQSFC
jgi:hypothetical protein